MHLLKLHGHVNVQGCPRYSPKKIGHTADYHVGNFAAVQEAGNPGQGFFEGGHLALKAGKEAVHPHDAGHLNTACILRVLRQKKIGPLPNQMQGPFEIRIIFRLFFPLRKGTPLSLT